MEDPSTPINDIPNRGVVEDLQNAINEMGSISVAGSAIKDETVEKKEYDLIEQMKT